MDRRYFSIPALAGLGLMCAAGAAAAQTPGEDVFDLTIVLACGEERAANAARA